MFYKIRNFKRGLRQYRLMVKGKLFSLPLFFSLLFVSVISSSASELLRPPAFADSGVVVTVYDGDTIKVQFGDGSSQRVRLIGVDTPEIDDRREDVDLWAHLARRFTSFYLYRKKIHLTYDQTRLDQYGRTLAYVWTDNEGLFNEFIIRQGFAFAFLAFPFQSDLQKRFKEAQQDARHANKGFWREGEPEVVSSKAARSHLGEYVSVRFACTSIAEKRFFVYLSSSQQEFEALIPLNRQSLFPEAKSYLGKVVIASGFLEEFKGLPQMMVFFPRQICSAAVQK